MLVPGEELRRPRHGAPGPRTHGDLLRPARAWALVARRRPGLRTGREGPGHGPAVAGSRALHAAGERLPGGARGRLRRSVPRAHREAGAREPAADHALAPLGRVRPRVRREPRRRGPIARSRCCAARAWPTTTPTAWAEAYKKALYWPWVVDGVRARADAQPTLRRAPPGSRGGHRGIPRLPARAGRVGTGVRRPDGSPAPRSSSEAPWTRCPRRCSRNGSRRSKTPARSASRTPRACPGWRDPPGFFEPVEEFPGLVTSSRGRGDRDSVPGTRDPLASPGLVCGVRCMT